MANKKQYGGDWIDKWQAHNRNVSLERQAQAAEEKARQAKLDRLDHEEHRRRMEKIEEKRASDEAARLQLAKDERDKKEKAKHENARIYNLYRRLKEIKEASTPGLKFLLISELQKEAETIDFDAVIDISYKDRFYKTVDALKVALDNLYKECGDNAAYLKAYEAAMQESQKEISSLSEIKSFEDVAQAVKVYPELLTVAAEDYKKRVNDFFGRASKAKSIFETLKSKSPESCQNELRKAIASNYIIPISVFFEKDYDSLETVSTDNENLSFIQEALMGFILDDSIPSEELQPLFDFIAERSSTKKIVVETYRREKAQEKLAQDIAKKKEQKELNEMRSICKAITTPEIMLKFDIPNEDDVENSIVAKAWHKTLGTIYNEIIFYRDHVCWLTENKTSFSVSWDDLVNSWQRDYKKGGFFSLPEFRGHKILDNRCVELFERLIAYKQSIVDQQEEVIMPPPLQKNLPEEVIVDQNKQDVLLKEQQVAPKKSSVWQTFTIIFILFAAVVGLYYLGYILEEEEKAEAARKQAQLEQEKRDAERRAIEAEAKRRAPEEHRRLELNGAKLAAEKALRARLEAQARARATAAKRRAEEERRRLELKETKPVNSAVETITVDTAWPPHKNQVSVISGANNQTDHIPSKGSNASGIQPPAHSIVILGPADFVTYDLTERLKKETKKNVVRMDFESVSRLRDQIQMVVQSQPDMVVMLPVHHFSGLGISLTTFEILFSESVERIREKAIPLLILSGPVVSRKEKDFYATVKNICARRSLNLKSVDEKKHSALNNEL